MMLEAVHAGAQQTEDDFELPILFYHKNNALVAYYDLECHDGFLMQGDTK